MHEQQDHHEDLTAILDCLKQQVQLAANTRQQSQVSHMRMLQVCLVAGLVLPQWCRINCKMAALLLLDLARHAAASMSHPAAVREGLPHVVGYGWSPCTASLTAVPFMDACMSQLDMISHFCWRKPQHALCLQLC